MFHGTTLQEHPYLSYSQIVVVLVATSSNVLHFLYFRYVPLDICISQLPADSMGNSQNWPDPWPQRLTSKPISLPTELDSEQMFYEDTKHWSALISDVYLDGLAVNWSSIRNVMDMNAGYGG